MPLLLVHVVLLLHVVRGYGLPLVVVLTLVWVPVLVVLVVLVFIKLLPIHVLLLLVLQPGLRILLLRMMRVGLLLLVCVLQFLLQMLRRHCSAVHVRRLWLGLCCLLALLGLLLRLSDRLLLGAKVLILGRWRIDFDFDTLRWLMPELASVLHHLRSDLRLHVVELFLPDRLCLLSFHISGSHVLAVELLADYLCSGSA